MRQQDVIVQVRGLEVAFGKRVALRGVDFDLPAQGVTAIIGPAGSGKSVLLKSLNRMNDLEERAHTSGKVLLRGEDIYAPKTDLSLLRQRVGLVFQKPAVFNMSVYDNVAFAPRLYGNVSRARLDDMVEEALEATALWDEVKGRLKRNAFQLTEGQQQRLCIARVLAADPEVLLMDEPTSVLDTTCRMRVEELVLGIAKTRPVVFACDNVHQAMRVADQCAFMMEGEIVEYAPAQTLFTFPQDERTEQYILGQMC